VDRDEIGVRPQHISLAIKAAAAESVNAGKGGTMSKIEQYITSIPDFPEPGIIFRDITTVIGNAEGLRLAVDEMAARLDGVDFDVIAGLESRGFLFGMPIAYKLGKPFIPIRKKGKLPRATIETSYELEYGTASIEVHRDDVRPGTRVVLVDDLIATGGTLEAAVRLIEQLGASVVRVLCLLELKGLHGRERITGCPVETVVAYEGK
jgi:adenine phosphoribosyltransferase